MRTAAITILAGFLSSAAFADAPRVVSAGPQGVIDALERAGVAVTPSPSRIGEFMESALREAGLLASATL